MNSAFLATIPGGIPFIQWENGQRFVSVSNLQQIHISSRWNNHLTFVKVKNKLETAPVFNF